MPGTRKIKIIGVCPQSWGGRGEALTKVSSATSRRARVTCPFTWNSRITAAFKFLLQLFHALQPHLKVHRCFIKDDIE